MARFISLLLLSLLLLQGGGMRVKMKSVWKVCICDSDEDGTDDTEKQDNSSDDSDEFKAVMTGYSHYPGACAKKAPRALKLALPSAPVPLDTDTEVETPPPDSRS
jgi:hypothetical protein